MIYATTPLICLYFNYKDIEQANFLTRWFKKKSINEQIREEFRRLENENFLKKFGINGIVLPELVNIEKEDVEGWAKEHLRSVWDIVRPKIADIFTSPDETLENSSVQSVNTANPLYYI